jgi:hypothetical protein
MLAARKRPQTSIPICLRLDIMAEIEELERKINSAQGNAVDDMRMSGPGDDAAGYAERIRELEALGAQYTVDLRVEALDRKVWPAKVAQFTEDDGEGNSKLDLAALVVHVLSIPGVIVSPEMTAGQRDELIDGLTDGQWETVMKSVFDLNRRTVSVGKSLTASLVTRPKSEKRGPAEQ